MDKSTRGAFLKSLANREPPKELGSREWPSPKASALEGKRFLITGIMDTIERDDLKKLIQGSGGRVMASYPKSLDYMFAGRDSGPSKMRKAEEDGVCVMQEDACYHFLCEKLGFP